MAAHGEIEYATADGNDLPAHEAGYAEFIEAIFIGATCVVTILFGLAVGGVLGYWLPGGLVILAAAIAAAISAWTGSRIPGLVMLAIAALTLLLTAHS
jgi:hypothetical protein